MPQQGEGGRAESSLRINLLLLMARRMRNMFSHYFNFFISLFFLSFSESEERAELGRRIVSEQVRSFFLQQKKEFLSSDTQKESSSWDEEETTQDRRPKRSKEGARKNENLIRLIYY